MAALAFITVRDSLRGDLAIDRERHTMWKKNARRDADESASELSSEEDEECSQGSPEVRKSISLAPPADTIRQRRESSLSSKPQTRAVLGSLNGATSVPDEDPAQPRHNTSAAITPWLYFWVPTKMFVQIPEGEPPSRSHEQEDIIRQGGLVVGLHELERPYGWPAWSCSRLFYHIEYVSY